MINLFCINYNTTYIKHPNPLLSTAVTNRRRRGNWLSNTVTAAAAFRDLSLLITWMCIKYIVPSNRTQVKLNTWGVWVKWTQLHKGFLVFGVKICYVYYTLWFGPQYDNENRFGLLFLPWSIWQYGWLRTGEIV